MADTCANCGSELFHGQRFCRACGSSTDSISPEEAPTQRMLPQLDQPSARRVADTAPTPKSHTNPVYAPPPSYYQPPVPPLAPQVMPPYQPPRSRAPWIPILIVIMLMVFGGAFFGVRSIIRNIRQGIREGVATRTASKEVVETRAYTLNKGAALSINTLNGDIVVQPWDQPQTEVKIIKSGGSDSDIQNIPITIKDDKNSLSIEAMQGRNNTKVRFEIKLPSGLELGSVKFGSTNGDISVTAVNGRIVIQTTNGDISIADVSGIEKVTTTNGDIDAQLNGALKGNPAEFVTTNGDIDLTLSNDFNAALEASTVHGSIDVDEGFNIPVQKSKPFGQRASGQIGKGGPPLPVSTTNGSISIKTSK